MLEHCQKITAPMVPTDDKQLLIVGRLGRSYGLDGWQHMQSFTQPEENLFAYNSLFKQQKNEWQPITILQFKQHAGGWIVQLDGIQTREQAAMIANQSIAVPRTELPKLPEGEFYWSDLEGLWVYTKEGVNLGKIEFLYENTGLDIMVVKTQAPASRKERHIPFMWQETVLEVDIIDNKVVVDWAFDIA